ncbi:phosphotransferase family protein [Halobellus ruber]|uniref:Aminoglycoside phosphotransferase family protein n=1 Tax=Halobellus ruber TaxID=2761102 RepID=A0A7J9SM55_9EURY|nr:aminoglycoside phosphotransferase family protein [Halobellus ruber]MBB6646101.1 aminoglycoside phosphotransferase family protein [Halobellus ruber]
MTEAPSKLGRIARRVRPDAVVERIEPIDVGTRRRTAVVGFADAEPMVVQLADNPDAARVETRLLDAIAERTSIPVPTPLGSGTVDCDGWLATALVAGDDLHQSFTDLDPAGRRRIARSFGRYLAALHGAFRFEGYGPLTVADGELSIADASAAGVAGDSGTGAVGGRGEDERRGAGREWRTWLARFGRSGLARLPPEFDALRADVAAVLDGFEADRAPVPRLFPWDLRPGNALIADGRVAAVLDWEAPLSAAPALSVAKTEYLVADWYVPDAATEPLREAFRAGYESVREYPRVRPVHRVAAVVSTAVDSRGAVTNPGYPPVPRADAVRFHLRTLRTLL